MNVQHLVYKVKRNFWYSIRVIDIFYGRLLSLTLKRFKTYSIRAIESEDIIIVGYPKSGTTWLQNLVASSVYGVDAELLPDSMTQELVPRLDFKILYKRISKTMFFCTHQKPNPKYRKVVYLSRDPRDAMASYIEMVNGVGKNVSSDEIIFNNYYLYFGPWHEHVESWISNPFDAELHFVKFEDLKTNTSIELQKILQFAGINRNIDALESAVAGNQLEVMKKKEKTLGLDIGLVKQANWKDGAMFNRSGKVGGYRDTLTSEQIIHLEKKSRKAMDSLGY